MEDTAKKKYEVDVRGMNIVLEPELQAPFPSHTQFPLIEMEGTINSKLPSSCPFLLPTIQLGQVNSLYQVMRRLGVENNHDYFSAVVSCYGLIRFSNSIHALCKSVIQLDPFQVPLNLPVTHLT